MEIWGGVITAIQAARQSMRTIRGNLFWAFFYNILLIPVAAGVAIPLGIQLNPMLAGVAMGLSSVCARLIHAVFWSKSVLIQGLPPSIAENIRAYDDSIANENPFLHPF